MDDPTAAVPSPLSDHLRTEVDALTAMLAPPPAPPFVFATAADDPPTPTARFEPPVAAPPVAAPPVAAPPVAALPAAPRSSPTA